MLTYETLEVRVNLRTKPVFRAKQYSLPLRNWEPVACCSAQMIIVVDLTIKLPWCYN